MATFSMVRARRTAGGSGLFRTTYLAMLGARERHARQVMNRHLLALDDTALATLGYDRESLQRHGLPPLSL